MKEILQDKFKYFIIFNFIILISYVLHIEFTTRQYINYINVVNRNIVKNIEDNDKKMEQILKSGILAWSAMYQLGYKNTQQAIKIRDILDSDDLDVYHKDGWMEFDTDGTHLKNGRLYEKFNKENHSLFHPNLGVDFKSMKKNPNVSIVTPYYLSAISGLIIRFGVIYNSHIQKFFFIDISRGKNIYNSIKDLVFLNPEVNYLKISNPLKEMTFYSRKPNYQPISIHKGEYFYDNKQKIRNENNIISIETNCGPFLKHKKNDQIAIGYNSKDEYFYILTAEYSKEKLNKQILILRIIFGLIFIFGNFILYKKR